MWFDQNKRMDFCEFIKNLTGHAWSDKAIEAIKTTNAIVIFILFLIIDFQTNDSKN